MRCLILAVLIGASTSVAMAQGVGDKPVSAVPPAGTHARAGTTNQPTAPASSRPASGTVVPGPASAHGDSNVGTSSESKGLQGSQGAGASATMQSGHTSNR